MTADAQLTMLTRLGFATRGLLYIVIAVLVIRTGRSEDLSGAIGFLGRGGGRVLLGAMAVGLAAYGLWRLADAAFDIERHGSDRKGLAARFAAGWGGGIYLFFTWQAVRLMRGAAEAGGNGAQEGTRTALQLPGGTILVTVAGAILLAVGAAQLVKAARARFLRHLEPRVAQRAWAVWSGRAGYAARGLVFLICGWFLIRAGLDARASEAGGMAKALSWLDNPWDIVVAAGLFGFGLFSLIEARFRILHPLPISAAVRRAAGR